MIALSAGVCYTPAGCPSPALPDLWLPPRARGGAAASAERQGRHPAAPALPATDHAGRCRCCTGGAAGDDLTKALGAPARGATTPTCSGPATEKRRKDPRQTARAGGAARASHAAPPGHAAAADTSGH